MEYVDTDDKLVKAAREWKEEDILGIDLECENNLHHYGTYLSLVQVSSKKKDYVVDMLVIKEKQPMIDMLKDKKVQKIFHDFSFDFRILEKELGVRPRNIFDTQIAAVFLGKDKLGLGSLLEEYFGVNKQSKFQMADWTKRPLTQEMIEYASGDTHYLIKLKDHLSEELEKLGRLEWVRQECDYLEDADLPWPEFTFMDVKGMKLISPKERSIVRQYFSLREGLAKKVDRPSHFVMSNKRMIEFAQSPPSMKQWLDIRGVHPIVRRTASRWHDAAMKGGKDKVEWPVNRIKRFSGKQRKTMETLKSLRESLADKFSLPRHLIMKDEQMKDIVLTGNLDCLRPWQRSLVEAKIYRS